MPCANATNMIPASAFSNDSESSRHAYDASQLRIVPDDAATPSYGWLRGSTPTVIRPRGERRLRVPLRELEALLTARRCAGYGQQRLWTTPRAYNPSIVPAPHGLCAKCAYLASIRLSTEHQCDASGQTLLAASRWSGFAGSALVALDSRLRVVASSWLLHAIESQVMNGTVVGGHRVHDVRLFAFGSSRSSSSRSRGRGRTPSRLFMTYHCHRCVLAVRFLHVSATTDRASGTVHLRVWSTKFDKFVLAERWLAGRNQVLFGGDGDSGGGDDGANVRTLPPLMLQPHIDTVADLGRPHFERRRGRDFYSAAPSAPRVLIEGINNHLGSSSDRVRRRHLETTSSKGRTVFGVIERVANHSNELARRLGAATGHERLWPHRHAPGRSAPSHRRSLVRSRRAQRHHLDSNPPRLPPRLSPTAHLIRVSRAIVGGGSRGVSSCVAYLGIGHLHHGQPPPPPPRGTPKWHRWLRARKASRFRWGYNYSHFWYTLSPRWPHRMMAMSGEWCIANTGPMMTSSPPGNGTACETVQYVSGLAPVPEGDQIGEHVDQEGAVRGMRPSAVLLAWGSNDCEALVGEVSMARIWTALKPLASRGEACEEI